MGGRKSFAAFLMLVSLAFSNPPCIDPISTVDWSFFVDVLELKGLCSCSTSGKLKVGLHFQVAEPIAFIEVPRRAWEFPCLGHRRNDLAVRRNDGTNQSEGASKVNVHYIKYPVFGVLNIVMDYLCVDKGTDFDFVPTGLSELNPLIWDDKLAALIQPWKLLFASPTAQITCLADCVATSTAPEMAEAIRNSMFWCAGCWGTIYPDTTTSYGLNAVQESGLIATRILDTMHESAQLFLYKETSGLSFIASAMGIGISSFDVKCQPFYFPAIVKSQYWLNLAYPAPEKAIPIGDWSLKWALMKSRPGEENFVWVVWRIRDCCVGFQFP